VKKSVLAVLSLAGCALSGLLAATVLAGTSPLTLLTTGSTTEPPPTTTATTATTPTATTGTTTATTTAAPLPTVIPDGVKVGGVEVGGLAPEVAFSVVRQSFESPLTLVFAGRTLLIEPERLGTVAYVQNAVTRARAAQPHAAVPLTIAVRGQRVREYVGTIAKRFDRTAVDSIVSLKGLRPFVTKGRPGRVLDRQAAVTAVVKALQTNRRTPIVLKARAVPQKVSRKNVGPVIVIRRGSNRLNLYDGMVYRKQFGVATGQARYPTPLGRFRIVVKWKNPWWYPPDSDWAEGQQPVPPGPDNPLGTRWMGISSPGVGIHGTPNPGSIGYSVSHGCIRMVISDAEWLFERVGVGTPVFIVRA
jgi:lipoprotein-anchoring transpeptidase ErfK/SrfK